MSLSQAGSSIVTTALLGFGGAALAAGAALLADARPWRRQHSSARRQHSSALGQHSPARGFGPPLALGLATAVSFGLTRSWPSFPPGQALHWLFYLALGGGLLGVLQCFRRVPWPARALVAAAVPFLLLEFQRRLHWGRIEGILWTAGLAAYLFAAWELLAWHEAAEPRDATRTLGWALGTALSAGTFVLAGGGVFAQLPGALALALGSCALLGFWRRSGALGAPGIAPFVLLTSCMVWAGRFLYDLTAGGFVLLSLAPLASLLERLVPGTRPRTRRIVALLAPPLVAGLALVLEHAAAPPPSPYD